MTGRTLFAIIWALLLLFAIYKIRKAKTEEAKARTERTAATLTSLAVSYGTLDYHDIDGDKSYGLYVSINDNPVFIDIRKDEFLDERKNKPCCCTTILLCWKKILINSLPKMKNMKIRKFIALAYITRY